MSKKVHSSGYPRKFIDKIALIKQKEALTNAYFESAIQGLSDISMKRVNIVDDNYLTETKTKIFPNDNINKLRDDFSNTSYSPESFTSDSTINNFQGNDHYKVNETNDEMKCLYENPNSEKNVFENVPSYGSIKFRQINDNQASQFQPTRLSNIEGYPNFNILTRDLNDQVCSGSLPDVSSFNNKNPMESVFNSERLSNPFPQYQDINNRDSINLKDALSALKKVKKEANSKKALFEHLKNRGLQNHGVSHPHHVLAAETPPNLVSMFGSPSMNRNRSGYIHNYDSTGCAANSTENGHLKHYSASKSPYLSLPVRDLQCNKDCDNSYRKRHASGNVISLQNEMELNLNSNSSTKNDSFKYKSLTPTETLQNSLFNSSNDAQLLSPVVYGMISADYRRVASDSSIQKSLKQCTNISQSNFSFNNEENTFGKIRNNREDNSANVYQRIKSMTSEPINPGPNPFNETQKLASYQRDISTSSSFLDNYISQNSPDENLDPNIDTFATPDKRQSFKFSEFKKFPEESQIINSNTCSCSNDGINLPQPVVSQQSFTTFVYNDHGPNFEVSVETQNSNYLSDDFTHSTDHNDQCYWTQPAESNQSKEPSPKIKPCENLDPLNVAVDLNTDFSCIPDITLNDEDAQRRDSLNMADEVLNNLNLESNNSEFNSFREKWFGYNNIYQPMDILSEEVTIKDCENEY